VLSYGELPLANALLTDCNPGSTERFPLTLVVCSSCGLVQLAETIAPAKLFRHYLYATSNSVAFVQHVHELAARLMAEENLASDRAVIEIASNDGYLLQFYRERGVPVLGIEPAVNIAQLARARGIDTVCEFFSAELAARLAGQGRRADLVHAHNVLAHVPDPRSFVAGLALILKPGGLAVVEIPYVRDLIDGLEFDTVYHEHVCYFSLAPLISLLASSRLRIDRVERTPMHGGSLLVFVRHDRGQEPDWSVENLLADERASRCSDPATLATFAERVHAFRPAFREFLRGLRRTGKSIAAYGASAKGATLLNFCNVDRDLIEFVVDRSPLKHGKAMPGIHLPIRPVEALLQRQPDYLLLLAWNFADEIMAQQAEYARRGGRFIMPLPTPHLTG
jgi:SAM-dependent methyltransferase